MIKGILTITAVAVLGLLSAYTLKHGSQNNAARTQPSNIQTVGGQSQTPADTSANSLSSPKSYKDGTYDGSAIDTPYGTVQVAVVVSGEKISDVQFLKMPSDRGHYYIFGTAFKTKYT
jgi:uncharacterized protein with FMN-binding domain